MPKKKTINLDYRPLMYFDDKNPSTNDFLPPLLDNEIEIATIHLESTNQDTISIRARLLGGKIFYRIVDEYETEFKISPTKSKAPLSLKELIDLIDSADADGEGPVGLTNHFRDLNLEETGGDPSEFVDFVGVESDFYPDLEGYYEDEAKEWLRLKQEEFG